MIDLIILFTIVYLFFMIYCLAELRGLRKYIETSNTIYRKYADDMIFLTRKGKK
jgi:hypothetical protein